MSAANKKGLSKNNTNRVAPPAGNERKWSLYNQKCTAYDTQLPTMTMSVGMGRIFESVCLFVCQQHNSKMKDPKVFKLGVGNDLGISLKWYCFGVQRSKVKVIGSIALHNNTSFPTTIAFFPHLLVSDTSTITLQLRFIVIRYSLGGDNDNSNTAWVHTL